MARSSGILFRSVPPASMRRANLLAAEGAAGPTCDAGDVLRLAVDVGLLALESAHRGHAPAVELCRSAGATIMDAQLSPVDESAPPAVQSIARELEAEGVSVGTLVGPKAKRAAKAPAEPKPETPVMAGWRTWLERYQLAYRRPYSRTATCGAAMIRLVDLALEMLEQLKRPLSDLDPLLIHRWDRYLADPGSSRVPGGVGFLRDHAHALRWAENGIPSYGTPWDKEASKAREPQALPPILPGGKKYAGRPGAP